MPSDMTYKEWKSGKYKNKKSKTIDEPQIIVKETIKENLNVNLKYNFIKANTIEEAENYAKQFIGDGYAPHFKNEIDFNGVSVENANEINRAIVDVFNRFDIEKLNGIKSVSPTSAIGKKAFKDGAEALFSYSPVEKGIYINKDLLKNQETFNNYIKKSKEAWNAVMNNIDKLSDEGKRIALKYKEAGRSLVDGYSIISLFEHELGHHIQWSMFDGATTNDIASRMQNYAPKISGYANTSQSEYFAESFVAYMKGEKDLLDKVYIEKLENNLEKNKRNDIISVSNEYVKSSTSALPTIRLSKQEYAHVVSEINTHLSDEQRKEKIVTKPIGNYVYTFVNYGYDNYRFIGKKKID